MIDWNRIRNGAEFQAMVNTLLIFDDDGAKPFNRAGPDAGQDAKSSDGRTIFQAKHHAAKPAPSVVLADARAELAKITEYRKPGHKNHALWRGVTHWTLVTNAPRSPGLTSDWSQEVVPAFTKEGLAATLWTTAELGALIARFPEVRHAFFEGATRKFLTWPEFLNAKRERHPLAFARWGAAEFVGRDEELRAIQNFLVSDRRFLLLHGLGGVGKTRLALEAAKQALDRGAVSEVLFGQLENLAASPEWFLSIVPERETLVVLDDPDDDRVVRRMLEEVAGGRAQSWRVVVVARSPKESVVSSLATESPLVAAPLAVGPPPTEVLQTIIRGMLERELSDQQRERLSNIDKAAYAIAKITRGFPMWVDAAVGLLAKGADLNALVSSNDTAELRKLYMREALGHEPRPAEQTVLRWVALRQPVERTALLELVAARTSTPAEESETALERLLDVGLVRAFGVEKRLVEVLPDVIRDHVLREWLSRKHGERRVPSEAGRELVKQVVDALNAQRGRGPETGLIEALARIEVIAEIDGLVDQVESALVTAAREAKDANELHDVVRVAAPLADYRPLSLVNFSATVRMLAVPSAPLASFFGNRAKRTHLDVVRELAWPLFIAGDHAHTRDEFIGCANELRAVYGHCRKNDLAYENDGKDPGQLWGRLLGDNHHEVVFEHTVSEARSALARLRRQEEAVPGDDSVIELALSRRRNTFDSWGGTATIGWLRVADGSRADKFRLEVRGDLWEVLEGLPPDSTHRERVLRLLDEAHRSARDMDRDERPPEITEDLLRCLTWLQGDQQLTPRETQRLREIWDWDLMFEQNEDIGVLAEQCEGDYLERADVGEIGRLFGEDWYGDEIYQLHQAKAETLARCEMSDIIDWFRHVVEVLSARPKNESQRANGIAGRLGQTGSASAEEAALALLAEPSTIGSLSAIAVSIVLGAMEHARSAGDGKHLVRVTRAALAAATNGHRRTDIIHALHGRALEPTPDDIRLLLENFRELLESSPASAFAKAGFWFMAAPDELRPLVDESVAGSPEWLGRALSAFAENLHFADKWRPPTPEVVRWLLRHLTRVDDLDRGLDGSASFHIGALVKHGATLSWEDFIATLDDRLGREAGRAVPHFFPVTKLVPAGIPPRAFFEAVVERYERFVLAEMDLGRLAAILDRQSGGLASAVENRLAREPSPPSFELLSKLAGLGAWLFRERSDADEDVFGSGASDERWARIARAVLGRTDALPVDKRAYLYHRLTEKPIRSFVGGRVVDAERRLAVFEAAAASNDDPVLAPLWEERVDALGRELARARELEEEEDW